MIQINDYPSAEKVFRFFSEISDIPRGSGNTKGIADYLVSFANERGLEVIKDEFDNVIIKKTATKGYEDRPTVILQGHTDIVAEKTPDCPLDLKTEGLKLYRDRDFLRAEGTSLGGDDGVAVAYALAILDSDDIPHPSIEVLLTSDEEVGLTGATGLDASCLKGKILINIDSDLEGIFTVGCAGGVRVDAVLGVSREAFEGVTYKLTVGGLLGGHSGMEIDKNRANAIKLLGESLSALSNIRIIELSGGSADNAIPRDAVAYFKAKGDVASEFSSSVTRIKEKWAESEKDLKIIIEESAFEAIPLSQASTDTVLQLIGREPTGVISMSSDIEGLVETSLNMGIANTEENKFSLSFSLRSSKNEEKASLQKRVTDIAKDLSAVVSARGEYPAWEYKKDSQLRDLMCSVYEKMYEKKPEILVIHAGLECGIFAGKIDGLDCVSIGPDNFDIHTPGEHLSIPSTVRVYEFILEVLKNIQ